jgi:hypothetical protein
MWWTDVTLRPAAHKRINLYLLLLGEESMYRGILTLLLSGGILLAFAVLPPMLPAFTTLSLSGSALAEKAPKTDATTKSKTKSSMVGGDYGHTRYRNGIGQSGNIRKATHGETRSERMNSIQPIHR